MWLKQVLSVTASKSALLVPRKCACYQACLGEEEPSNEEIVGLRKQYRYGAICVAKDYSSKIYQTDKK